MCVVDRHGARWPLPRGQLGDRTVAVTSGHDGTVELWQVGEDGLTPVGDPQPGHRSKVSAVAIGQLGDRTVAVTGGDGGVMQLWSVGSSGLVSIPSARIPLGSP